MSYIDLIYSEIIVSGEEPAFAGEFDASVVEEFEKELAVKFPSAYKEFLMKFGALSFAGDTYYGITKSGIGAKSTPSVVFATNTARSQGNADTAMIVVKASGYGPIYSIDTSIVSDKGECPVIETELSYKRDGKKVVISESFEDFFCNSIRQAIKSL